jgi:hypothetical protein
MDSPDAFYGRGTSSTDEEAFDDTRKKTWTELKMIVNGLRNDIPSVSSLQPTQIAFHKILNGKVRLYYLVNSSDCWNAPLLRVTIPTTPDRSLFRLV